MRALRRPQAFKNFYFCNHSFLKSSHFVKRSIMRSENLYSTLGIDTNASHEEIRKAYRQLALRYHPDKNNDDAGSAARFKEIHHAYHILSDPQRRSAYNQKTWFYKHAVTRQTRPLTPYHFFTKT